MSWMRSGTELSQFRRVFLPTLAYTVSSAEAFDSAELKILKVAALHVVIHF